MIFCLVCFGRYEAMWCVMLMEKYRGGAHRLNTKTRMCAETDTCMSYVFLHSVIVTSRFDMACRHIPL